MNITVINGSPRVKGNTEIMAEEFAKGARENGHEVEIINLAGKKISGCMGCMYCFSSDGVCVQKDDMVEILASIDKADLVAFASPIYWFEVTAQLKSVIDRMYARAKKGFHFNQSVLLLDSGSPGVYDAAIAMYKGMTGYLHWEDKGIITISGMTDKGSMAQSPELKKAYELGRTL